MANRTVTQTVRARIVNQSAVRDDLDSLGFAASKLWNVARWTAARIWSETGHIPGDGELKAYLKSDERYADLHSQSSQRVIEELAEAFTGWYGHRQNGNQEANPPSYRKHGDQHPRSTVTFKQAGFTHDADYGRVRLSKGRNLKESAYAHDFVLCEYDVIGPLGTTVENVQQVRAVHEYGEWRLHFVCRVEIGVADTGDRTAGIDLGISNVGAVSFGDEAILYPGGALKEDEYYFAKERAKRDDPACREARRLDEKRTVRQTHFLHALSKHIVSECVKRGVGTIAVGDLGGIRDGEDGKAKNWGRHGNHDLHGWAFDRFTKMLEYKAEAEGIDVKRVDERGTSQTCSVCGTEDSNQRVERGLYDCACGVVAKADVNGAENIRQQVPPSLAPDGGDRSTGWLAQPAVYLFDKTTGCLAPRKQVVGEP